MNEGGSDETIQLSAWGAMDCFAAIAMTGRAGSLRTLRADPDARGDPESPPASRHLPLTSCSHPACCDFSRLFLSSSNSATRFAGAFLVWAATVARFTAG